MSLPNADAAARAALAAELAPAQVHAERHFGAGPPPLWQPTWSRDATRMRPRTMLRAAGALALLAMGVGLAWRIAPTTNASLPAPAQPVADAAHDEVPGAATVDSRDAPPSLSSLATNVFTLAREGAGWRIEAAGANRLAAAQRLAQLGAGTLHGELGLLAGSRPLDLSWQGRRLADAWPAVLGSEASYALQCGRTRCEVWLIAGAAPRAVRERHDTTQALTATAPLPTATVSAVDTEPALSASPSDSADPRVAAHHD